MTAALEGVSGQQHAPAILYLQERPSTHHTGGWVGPRASLDGWKISPHQDSIPRPTNLYSVAIPTELPGPLKCTLVQALRLCTGRTAHRGSRGIALLSFHDHGTRRRWGVSITPWLLFSPGKDLIHIVQEAGWAPGPVWTGAENLALHWDSIPGPSSP